MPDNEKRITVSELIEILKQYNGDEIIQLPEYGVMGGADSCWYSAGEFSAPEDHCITHHRDGEDLRYCTVEYNKVYDDFNPDDHKGEYMNECKIVKTLPLVGL